MGAVNCDGTRASGYFWSAALGWSLVWNQDQETAIQSHQGGSKLTWSGPPLMPRSGRDRLRFIVAPTSGDSRTELQHLISLGASESRTDDDSGTILVDPDGNEFVLKRSEQL
ncbi:hypothetical protein IV500_20900 [Paeniglutamicibacter antarcticus]|uniref:Glyoxalase-like domain-containing protein n=1 Tax=Arthrobacter terrae TaxID=2935737 RepID=A0A931CSV2_9MICC|nr:hypothetical protein [Arthrobacter terrae]